MSEGSNGNGHSSIPVSPLLGFDAGADRDKREPKPCLKRVVDDAGRYGFCGLPDGHESFVDSSGNKTAPLCGAAQLSLPEPSRGLEKGRR